MMQMNIQKIIKNKILQKQSIFLKFRKNFINLNNLQKNKIYRNLIQINHKIKMKMKLIRKFF